MSGGQQNKDEERELHVSRSILCQSMVNSCLRARTRVLSTIEGYLKEDFDAEVMITVGFAATLSLQPSRA